MKKLILFIVTVVAFSMCAQAQQVKRGAIEVGDFTNAANFYNGSYFDMAPTNFYLPHTGVQMLYTPDVLESLEGKENVKITGLRFKFNSQSFEEITRIIKVYLQETDAEEFAINEDGIKQFFDFEGMAMEGNYGFDLLNCYGEDVEVYFPLSSAFALASGKSLLVTIVMDAQDDDNCTMGSDYAPFYTSGIGGKAMTYTNNWNSFLDYAQGNDFPNATASLGCGVDVELPVTLIEYTYTEGGSTGYPRGDTNLDGNVDVSDVTALINFLLMGEW